MFIAFLRQIFFSACRETGNYPEEVLLTGATFDFHFVCASSDLCWANNASHSMHKTTEDSLDEDQTVEQRMSESDSEMSNTHP